MLWQTYFRILLLISLNISFLRAQEPYIFSNDIFSGISSVGLSPTQSYLNPNWWDVHVISEDVFLQNRYGYISKTSLFGLSKGEIQEVNLSENITGTNTKKVWDFYNYKKTGYHFSSELMGPSASKRFSISEKEFVVGFFSRLRTQSSIINADNYLQFENQRILEPVLYNLSPFDANFMNWSEIGINFSTEFFPYSDFQWIAGLNLKYLMGHDSFYIKNKSDALMRREFVDDPEIDSVRYKNMHISNFDVEVGYATAYDFENENYKYKTNGKGFGMDLGVAFLNRERGEEGYNFKFNANVLDIGQINFNGFVHSFQSKNLQYTNNPAFDEIEFENPEQMAQLISQEIYGDPNKSLKSTDFKIGLPTRIHLNASQKVGFNRYLNLNLVQRIPVFENSLRPPNTLNLSYITQTHLWSYGGSVSLYEYRQFQMGAFLRFGPFILGSENFLPLFIPQKKLHAFDFYFGIKIYPFRNREMERRSKGGCNC